MNNFLEVYCKISYNVKEVTVMATYVMSDIHGEYGKFIAMLELIKFSDKDTLFVTGDMVNKGPEPIKLLKDLSTRSNIFCLLGNHELMAIDILETLLVEIQEDNYDSHIDSSVINKLIDFQRNGGDITLKQFKELPYEERFDLLDYLKDFELYDVIDVGDKTFILSHTGNINPNKNLSDHSVEELTFIRAYYDKQVFTDPNVYIVCGHTPTLAITGKPEIYHKNNYINIDCGAAFNGKLACLRLDDFKEFYI